MDSKAIRYKDPWFRLPWLWKADTLWPSTLQCKSSLWLIINADPVLGFLHCNVAVGSVAIVLKTCCLCLLCKAHKMNPCVPKYFLTSEARHWGSYITLCRKKMEQYLHMRPTAICQALPSGCSAQTTDKHNSDSVISFSHIYLQITLNYINQIHDGKYCKLQTTTPLQNIVLNMI